MSDNKANENNVEEKKGVLNNTDPLIQSLTNAFKQLEVIDDNCSLDQPEVLIREKLRQFPIFVRSRVNDSVLEIRKSFYFVFLFFF
jgi:hypothetical protein